jgi:hypothetical protein
MCPHHGPWNLSTGLSIPTLHTCQPWPLGNRADLPGAHGRSLWRDFGSEKLRALWGGLLPTCGNWLMVWLLQPPDGPGWHHCPALPGCQWAMYSPGHMGTAQGLLLGVRGGSLGMGLEWPVQMRKVAGDRGRGLSTY